MERNLQTIFNEAKHDPKSGLSDDIWQKIVVLEERRSRMQLWGYGIISMFSFIALFPVISDLRLQFTQSGFYEYVSLALSDGGAVVSYWQDFVLSLANALPTSSLILSFSLLFLFLFSFKRAARRFNDPLLLAA